MGMTLKIVIYAIISVVGIILLISMAKSGHWFKAITTTALSGFAALLAVNLLGMISDIVIPINGYTLALSGILGVPGTILTLVIMATFLK